MNVAPSNFGRQIIEAHRGIAKSAADAPVVATGSAHLITFDGEAPGQLSHIRPPMGAPTPMEKAHVSGHTRANGTKVEAYERGPQPQAKTTGPTPQTIGQRHAAEVAKHERLADERGPDHPHHPHHVALAALHQGAMRCVRQGAAATTEKERNAVLARYKALNAAIADKGRAFTTPAPQASRKPAQALPASKGQTMTKSTPVLFRKVAPATPKKGGTGLSNLIGEMAHAATLAKSHGPELWAHGKAFA